VLAGLGAVAAAAAVGPLSASPARTSPRFADDPFSLGVASGCPTRSGVVLWTRLAPEPLAPGGGLDPVVLPVDWEIAEDAAFRRTAQSGRAWATPDAAHSVHVELRGLEADREYWYRFRCGEAMSAVGRTRTAPAPETMTPLRIGLASCQMYEHGWYTGYRAMVAADVQLIVHVGDYLYEHTIANPLVRGQAGPECYTLDDYRARYALYRLDPDLRAAHAHAPWIVTWDDHEVDNDYAADRSEENEPPARFLARREAAYRAYYEHLPLPRRAVPHGGSLRLHGTWSHGGLARLITLDTRQYRSPIACPAGGHYGGRRVDLATCPDLLDPSRTMLGTAQEEWLDAQLARNEARWTLLAQSLVMAYVDEDPGPGLRHWTDGWNGYPAARQRLVESLARREAPNPVVLSGDIHSFVASEIHRVPQDPQSPRIATEITTTSISSYPPSESVLETYRSLNPAVRYATGRHRGYAQLDVRPERIDVSFVAVDALTASTTPVQIVRRYAIEAGRAGLLDA
jgi:alkaline phosphatase D